MNSRSKPQALKSTSLGNTGTEEPPNTYAPGTVTLGSQWSSPNSTGCYLFFVFFNLHAIKSIGGGQRYTVP